MSMTTTMPRTKMTIAMMPTTLKTTIGGKTLTHCSGTGKTKMELGIKTTVSNRSYACD